MQSYRRWVSGPPMSAGHSALFVGALALTCWAVVVAVLYVVVF